MEHHENTSMERTQQVTALTSYMVRKHYCENDPEALIALLDDQDLFWQGAGEKEYAVEAETVFQFFRGCTGRVPTCRLFKEEYHVLPLANDIYLCSGHYWLETLPSTKMYLRVHQRITTIFRYVEERPRCCHIHISNPYSEMAEDEIVFPHKMGEHSYQYLQEQLTAQAKRIQSQTAMLKKILLRDSLTGMFNRHKFNQALTALQRHSDAPLGIAYFDLNGLKQVNDRQGHNAGDRLLLRAAAGIGGYHGRVILLSSRQSGVEIHGGRWHQLLGGLVLAGRARRRGGAVQRSRPPDVPRKEAALPEAVQRSAGSLIHMEPVRGACRKIQILRQAPLIGFAPQGFFPSLWRVPSGSTI